MSALTSDFRSTIEAELRLSAKWISALLIAIGLYVFLVGDIQFQSIDRVGLLRFSVVLLVGAGLIWFLDDRQTHWSPWFAILMIVGAVHFGITLFGSDVHSLATIPIILAMALVGPPGATTVVLAETASLFAYSQISPSGNESTNLVIEFLTLWGTWLAVIVLTNPVQHITQWSWEQYRKIEELLEEARNQRAELKRAMEDLVYANRQQMLLNERITVMRLAAEEAQKAKAVFVARVSHEFRTPLNMIIGLIDSVMESPEIYGEDLPAALIQDLEIVHRNCMHLAGMINDVLDLSKTDAARMTLRRDWVDLAAEVTEVLSVTKPLLEKKRLQLFSEIERGLPPVYCDRIRIRQVIINLISNAIRFTDEGSVTIKLAAEAEGTVVSVSDTGAGIDKNEAEEVFDPFFQTNRNSLHGTGGTGLGLTISKYLIEMHAGKIWLTSELGKGSIFSFWLPQQFPDSPTVKPQLRWKDSAMTDQSRREGQRVAPIYPERFVIWDDLGGLEALITQPADGFEFVRVHSIEQAEEKIAECPAQAFVMNLGSSSELDSLIDHARSQLRDTPIIACAVKSIRDETNSGAVEWLVKPFRSSDLRKTLEAQSRPIQNVIVVEEDVDMVRLLNRMLLTWDNALTLRAASTGWDALGLLGQFTPDLILLDYQLPDMDGSEFLARLKEDESLRDVPVIVVSAQEPELYPPRISWLATTFGVGLAITQLPDFASQFSAFCRRSGAMLNPTLG